MLSVCVPCILEIKVYFRLNKISLVMKKGIIFLMVLLLPLSHNLLAQKTEKKYYITGQVVDINNKPVSGAIVLVDNINTYVESDAQGMYKVRVKTNAIRIAVFKPVNGQSEEDINGRTVINFSLPLGTLLQTTKKQEEPDNDKINIGYGSAKKDELTTNPGRIEGSKKSNAAYQNIYEMISGQVPGVQVNGKTIVIRGTASINNTDPLLVVDGIVVSSIDDISPQIVKSIEILKGGDAAVYGSRGANGVIMITLKK
jgi:TonB-dependent SusC/RagA subfamily outer membrane receptor